jgi:hypothetical protein
MRVSYAAVLLVGGCADLAGIHWTTPAAVDASPHGVHDARPDARPIDVAIDAPPCNQGDKSTVDPTTGACYMFFATAMTHDAANATCRSLAPPAFLTSIRGVIEEARILELVGTTSPFVGANDFAVTGTFVWEDSTPFVYTNWAPGEPNGTSSVGNPYGEHCVILDATRSHQWDDVACTPDPYDVGSRPFVCKRG